MSGREMLASVAQVVAVFSSAADTLAVVKERKEKKKRKKDKEFEELVEIRLLHKSLQEGANQSRLCSEDRHQRYGLAFDMGDHIATSQLKDVVITLQTNVIQALQIAKAIESAMLDLTSLHESSIRCRSDAMRAMDDLCRRIMSGGSMYGQYGQDMYGQRVLAESPRPQYAIAQMVRTPSSGSNNWYTGNVGGYSPNVMPCGQASPTNHHPAIQRVQSAREPPNFSMNTYRHSPSHSWGGTPAAPTPNWMTPQRQLSEHEAYKVQNYNTIDQLSELSLRDSVIGSPVPSKHSRGVHSVDSTAVSDIPRQTSLSERSTNSHQSAHLSRQSSSSTRNQSITSETRRRPVPSNNGNNNQNDEDHMRTDLSDNERETRQSQAARTASGSGIHSAGTSATSATIETADDMSRAMHAPEVVTNENPSMLSQQQNTRSPPRNQTPSRLAPVHPAFRYGGNYVEGPNSPEPDNVWSPLPRPAKHNNYHGFCKGAWQIRRSVHEGSSIQMIPDANGDNTPHWTCKHCAFRSAAIDQDALPDQIYSNAQSGVRYRWLFLAKSHIAAVGSFNKPENCGYGCIFCAAEGRMTSTFERLDKLMTHILAKHNPVMMTPETKEKTKCIVGGTPNETGEWDINLPETKPKFGGSGVVGGFLGSAVSGLSRYGSQNPA